ncbi:MAG TPA: gamma carbonic anhydrase family protein [Desulfobacteria bacterium]|nr:gamma carbonic anhydrase family protein [Desulfobacteria bacterium]
MLYSFGEFKPTVAADVMVADGAKIIGNVSIGEQSTVWFNVVIRGDLAPISIGCRTNIQDSVTIHVNKDQPVVLGDEVSIGHGVILHGCYVGKGSLIGMGAIILNGSLIGEETLVAAGTLVPENKTYPPRVLLMGSPAKVIRELSDAELQSLRRTVQNYIQKGREYRSDLVRPLD